MSFWIMTNLIGIKLWKTSNNFIILLDKVCLLHVTRTNPWNTLELFVNVDDGGGVKLNVIHEVHK